MKQDRKQIKVEEVAAENASLDRRVVEDYERVSRLAPAARTGATYNLRRPFEDQANPSVPSTQATTERQRRR